MDPVLKVIGQRGGCFKDSSFTCLPRFPSCGEVPGVMERGEENTCPCKATVLTAAWWAWSQLWAQVSVFCSQPGTPSS